MSQSSIRHSSTDSKQQDEAAFVPGQDDRAPMKNEETNIPTENSTMREEESPTSQLDGTSSLLEHVEALMQEQRETLLEAIQRLREDFTTKIMYDQHQERVVEHLHQELQESRHDLKFRLIEPMFIDLWMLYRDIRDTSQSILSDPSVPDELRHFADQVRVFCLDIEEIFARNGAELYSTSEGVFDGKSQRAQRTKPTDVSSLNGHVAYSIYPGLRYGKRIVRRELVAVYKYTPPDTLSESSENYEGNAS